jgi:hypothetical protein
MKNISFRVLLGILGGLFIFSAYSKDKEISFQNVFLYKINESVYSMQDLLQINKELTSLKCIYEDSVLAETFKEIIEISSASEIFAFKDYTKEKYSKNQLKVYQRFISYSKLFSYVESHKVAVQESVVKAFYLASKKMNCSDSIFASSTEFTKSFNDTMRLEIFLRTRFVPETRGSKLKDNAKKDFELAISGIKTLLKTINKQIPDEVYW